MFTIIIPARYSSTRLPGKPLIDINGKPMIVRVMEQAIKSNAKRIIIATDHKDIANVITKNGGEICMTNNYHRSGIERIAEVINIYKFSDDEIIVNVQGDEPFIPPENINKIAYDFLNKKTNMITLATHIKKSQDFLNSNIVKVVIDKQNYAIYFSRSPIPWNAKYLFTKSKNTNNLLRHIGIYAYNAGFIRHYINLEPSPLEKIEKLEQNRVLWHREKIYVSIVKKYYNHSIDTLEDLKSIKNFN
ncbi:3-deoxy-manno-octulosonate cytidylyltransferase [Candidatus Providencia siddallii]|uniref:3-deoxy-manno-octulosonate cytidylyltransferase n=1 Tax=Candidatus Providencia siddallii TaxID=1715285 RepID=A0ABM9NPL4_9GAMM